MKKILLLNLILAFFFATGIGFCEEDLFIGVPFDDTRNKIKTLPQNNEKTPEAPKKIKKNGKFKKIKKYNYDTNKNEEVPQGYYGNLPDIEAAFNYKKQKISSPRELEGKIPDREDLKDENLKEAPFSDPLFLDNIVKKEKTSNYVNDLQKTKLALNNVKKCLEEQSDIQRFNGSVNMLDLYVKNLKTKYENQSESLKESYIDILNTNYYCKVLGNLIYDSNYYSKYIPTASGKYSKENIDSKKQDLLNKINKTLFLIANES